MNGIDRLLNEPELPGRGASIGFVGHRASVTQDGRHTVEALLERGEWTIKRLFGPEHGFDGQGGAGEPVPSSTHPDWNLPIYSLYGKYRSPPPHWLEDLDLLVVDLQDLGVRFYTYASTLDNLLKACAEQDLPVLVLDRPTPLSGIVDGPGLEPSQKSFVGQVDLPAVFGWGQGALAMHLHQRLPELASLNLQVYSSDPTPAKQTWIPPSPAIVSDACAGVYPMTVWCEAIEGVFVDRGGPRSFQVWGMEDLPVERLLDVPLLGGEWTSSSCLTSEGKTVPAVEISITDIANWKPVTNAVHLLSVLAQELGSERLFSSQTSRPEFFDKLMGTPAVRKELINGTPAGEICAEHFFGLPDD